MFCTKCGVPLRDDDRFCSQCGNATALGREVPIAARTLRLDKANKKLAGVCAGFARYFEMDVSLMRVLWLAMIIITGGLGLFVYIAAWLVVPADPVPNPFLIAQRVG
jgi:phage shock protein C